MDAGVAGNKSDLLVDANSDDHITQEAQDTQSEDSSHLPDACSIAMTDRIVSCKTEIENDEEVSDNLEDTAIEQDKRVPVQFDADDNSCSHDTPDEIDAINLDNSRSLQQGFVIEQKDATYNDDIPDLNFSEGRASVNAPLDHQSCYSPSLSPHVTTFDNVYDFSHSKRGYAVIIVNEFKGQDKRGGAEVDLRKMKFVARKLGFEILNDGNECNLDKLDTLRLLTRARQLDHSNCDSFALMISTHGCEQRNARAKVRLDHALVSADNEFIFTRDILEMFDDKRCPSLKDKPKLFFIQACRGMNPDLGCTIEVIHRPRAQVHTRITSANAVSQDVTDDVNVNTGTAEQGLSENKSQDMNDQNVIPNDPSHEMDAFMISDSSESRTEQTQIQFAMSKEISDIYSSYIPVLRCHADMLVMYAIPDGMAAWRHPIHGSWMIEELHKVIYEYDMTRPKSFLKLLTKVSARMSLRKTHQKHTEKDTKMAVPVIEHKLVKDILFDLKTVK